MNLSGGGGVGLVLILSDFPPGSPAPHSHNPSCLTSHNPLTTFSDHWTTSAPVLNVSNPPGLRPVTPPIHPADVHFPTPHFYTRHDPLITLFNPTAMYRDAFPSKNMPGAVMQLFGKRYEARRCSYFALIFRRGAMRASVRTVEGLHGWQAYQPSTPATTETGHRLLCFAM